MSDFDRDIGVDRPVRKIPILAKRLGELDESEVDAVIILERTSLDMEKAHAAVKAVQEKLDAIRAEKYRVIEQIMEIHGIPSPNKTSMKRSPLDGQAYLDMDSRDR